MGKPPMSDAEPDQRESLPPTAVVFLVFDDGWYVERYGADGSFAGDTWHPSRDEAEHQVAYEFDGTSAVWIEVPPDIQDFGEFTKSLTRGD